VKIICHLHPDELLPVLNVSQRFTCAVSIMNLLPFYYI
jgi:hypothetical protein